VKALVMTIAVLGGMACRDTTPPAAQAEASPSAITTETPTPTTLAQTVVTFLNAPLTVAHGRNATLKVRTAASISCSIEVDYKSGPLTAAGLVTKNSDGAGNVSWTWKVGTNTTRGAWPIIVSCGSGSAQTHITVT
jgi:micrococcal nuclease